MSAQTLSYFDGAITIDPDLCNGKPTVRGQRITVESILEYLASGDSFEEILQAYPTLTKEDIQNSLSFATQMMANRYTLQKIA